MKTFKTHLLAAALSVCFPAIAMAQSVVPPPTPPGVQVPAAAPVAAPKVAPPIAVSSVNPAAAAMTPPPAAQLIDIALPDAPKPDPKPDLKPAGPAASTSASAGKAAAKKAAKASDEVAKVEAPVKAADPFEGLVLTPVSNSRLNRFIFPEAVGGVFFPEGSPLPTCPPEAGPADPCQPQFRNGKRVMLLQLRAGAKGPVQMMVELASGRYVDFNLAPFDGPMAVVRVDGADEGASDARLAASQRSAAGVQSNGQANPSEQYVTMLSKFAAGNIPEGFDPIKVGPSIRFEHFDVVPLATWDNGANLRAHLMQVKAHSATPVLINASLFRNENVRALALDRETITNTAPAQLFLLEFVPPTEAQ